MEAHKYWSVDPAEPVKIRMGTDGPAAYPPVTITECFSSIAAKHPDHPALVYEDQASKQWQTVTYSAYERTVQHTAKAFIKLGLEPRHSVGILSFNCPEWFYSALGAIFIDSLAAGVYTTNSADAVAHVLSKSRSNIVVVEDDKQLKKVLAVKDQLPHLKSVVLLNGSLDASLTNEDGFYTWKDVQDMDVDSVSGEFHSRLAQIRPNQSAVLIFTSGTVGMPKGVLLSHDNITWNTQQVENFFGCAEKARDVFVSYLPLSHVAGQFMDLFLAIYCGATVYFADKNALKGTLIKTIRKARPTRFMGVPRIYEKFQDGMLQKMKHATGLKHHLLNWAKYSAFQHYSHIVQRCPSTSWQYLLSKSLILNKIKAGMGFDRCSTMIVGAAPTALEVKEFYMSVDMPLIDLFGMSETAGPVTIMEPSLLVLESVGKKLPGTDLKILNPDSNGHGDMAIRGRHIFMGYITDEEKTIAAFDKDGWMSTGDLSYIDKEGFVCITGRIKELIITAGGENIPPVHIEELVKNELPCVSNAFLVGDHRKYLTMLITLKTEMDVETGAPKDELFVETKEWLNNLGLDYKKLSQVISSGPCPEVVKAIESGIVRANSHAISNAQKVQKFRILPHDFSIPTGEMGPTLKVKRNVVLNMYSDLIEEMYKD